MSLYTEKKQHYATSCSLKPSELYYAFPRKYIRHNTKDLPDISTRILCSKVFRYFFKLVIEDIIEHQDVFKFPPCNRGACYIKMDGVTGDEFITARKNGAFQDVDYLASNFTGYNIFLQYSTRYGSWKKRIYVNARYKDRITELTNQGVGW